MPRKTNFNFSNEIDRIIWITNKNFENNFRILNATVNVKSLN